MQAQRKSPEELMSEGSRAGEGCGISYMRLQPSPLPVHSPSLGPSPPAVKSAGRLPRGGEPRMAAWQLQLGIRPADPEGEAG